MINYYSRFLVIIFIISSQVSCKKQTPEWNYIFDGATLEGWNIKGGNALYTIENKSIIGTSTLNTANTFLCTDKIYSDFILELEYKVDPLLNSGIQIRSNSFSEFENGRVHGYQVEIDPSERSWSGGIYEEAKRGWLYDLKENDDARKAFKQNDWNHYRIEAIGDTIKTWINNVQAAHIIDNITSSGFIGLQVHDIGLDTIKNGTQVQWKNIRINTKDVSNYSKKSILTPKIIPSN